MIITSTSPTLLPRVGTDLVTFEIKINGEKISAAYQVISIIVQEEINKIPSAEIVIRDGSASEETFEVSDKGDFLPKKRIEIFLGYHNKNELVFKGEIISNSHSINSHCCEINISSKDERICMSLTNNGKQYEEKTDDEIVDELIGKYNILPTERKQNGNEQSVRYESLIQSNVTDWDFMISRIDVSRGICAIHNGSMEIIKPDLSTPPSLFLTHGIDILDFNADMDSRHQASEVRTASWDYNEQKVNDIEGEYPTGVESEKDPQIGDNSEPKETIKDFLDNIVSVFNRPLKMNSSYMKIEELKAISDSKLLKVALSPVKGSVKYQGSILALPGNFISIQGVGRQLSGKHFVSAIKHDYSNGCWTTEATIGWDEKFFTENIYPHHPSSSTGQISTIQGLHVGIVTDLKDPSGQYRVKVKLPLINHAEDGVYARIATLDAGNNRGTFFRPEIDDEVLVGFMNDDPRHPVILGMLHSSKKAAPLEPENDNPKKGYVSRSGIKLLFNDEKKSLLIETPGSRIIEMDDDAGMISIKDANGNKIIMDSNGITIESVKDLAFKAAKSISFSAPTISLKADATLSVEGSGSTSVKSSGVTEIKGSLVKIN